jgi:hypothetical protein
MRKIIGTISLYSFQPLSIKGCLLHKRNINNFFLSFSDAFVYILNHHKFLNKGEKILVPNFYCIKQLDFMSKYLDLVFYKINDDFSVDKKNYFKQIEKHNPKVIINYSFTGLDFSSEEKEKITDVCNKGTVIIEDCAQRILSDSELNIIHENYYYVDSIRKHCSLLGSHIINPFLKINKKLNRVSWYKLKCEILYFFYKIIIFLIYIFPSKDLFIKSERFFKLFNENIGNISNKPSLGSKLSFHLYNFIDFEIIKKHNKKIINKFKQYFDNINNTDFKTLPKEILNNSELINYFPVFVKKEIQEDLVDFLTQSNIFVWHLWDIEQTPYSSELNSNLYDSFLVFPIHWLIKEKDVDYICSEIDKFIKGLI